MIKQALNGIDKAMCNKRKVKQKPSKQSGKGVIGYKSKPEDLFWSKRISDKKNRNVLIKINIHAYLNRSILCDSIKRIEVF